MTFDEIVDEVLRIIAEAKERNRLYEAQMEAIRLAPQPPWISVEGSRRSEIDRLAQVEDEVKADQVAELERLWRLE